MGEIVAAMGMCHAPQLITRPPDEKPEQLDASIAAMRAMGKILDETKPDVIIIFGADHLETFSMTCVPTFALVAGNRAVAKFGGANFDIPVHREMAEDILEKLVHGGFDMAYSEDAELGHTFATPFKYLLDGRNIPVIPFFTNVYVPPLPTADRCAALGEAIKGIIQKRKERVCVIASGGMSHYPGTSKYYTPEFDFDRWMISQLEIANVEALLRMTPSQLDEVGNTEMLCWAHMFGMIGAVPGELLQYTPTWHHGHGYMRFLPQRERATPILQVKEEYGGFKFKNQGFEFYKHPPAEAYPLNKLLFETRTDAALRQRIIDGYEPVAQEYGLNAQQTKALRAMIDVKDAKVVSDYVKPLTEAGAHPLQALMALHVIFSMNHRAAKAQPLSERKN